MYLDQLTTQIIKLKLKTKLNIQLSMRTPAMQALRKETQHPPSIALRAICAMSDFRSGAIAPNPGNIFQYFIPTTRRPYCPGSLSIFSFNINIPPFPGFTSDLDANAGKICKTTESLPRKMF